MANPLLSIVIPTCNRNELLAKCLERLTSQVQSMDDGTIPVEVIVTDDSRTNTAQAFLTANYPWAQWIQGPQRGPAANRNNGAKYALGEWLIFLDDDVLPDTNILAGYYKQIQAQPMAVGFEGAIFPDDESLMKKDLAECPINTTGGYFWSANICVRKQAFDAINGFDETFLLAAQEDQDFYERLLQQGQIVFAKECFVVHAVRIASLKKKLKQIGIATKNWFIYERKHQPQTPKRILSLTARFVWDFSRSTIRDLFKGKFKSATLQMGYLLYGIPVYLREAIKHYPNAKA